MLKVEELKPGGYDMCGHLPDFFSEYDPRSAKEQINDNYRHGGGWHPMERWTFDIVSKRIKYPGDPEMYPVAKMTLHEGKEEIFVYPHAWVVVSQPAEGTWEIARCD